MRPRPKHMEMASELFTGLVISYVRGHSANLASHEVCSKRQFVRADVQPKISFGSDFALASAEGARRASVKAGWEGQKLAISGHRHCRTVIAIC
jgi:hypothetical protein